MRIVEQMPKGFLKNEKALNDFAKKIALEAPSLANLNAKELEQAARIVVANRLTRELEKKVNFSLVDIDKEKETFLAKCQSKHTKRTYKNALEKLFSYFKECNIEALELTPQQADNFIYNLASKASPALARLTASVANAFYSFLERRVNDLKNPFRGTKARPKERKVRNFAIPNQTEIETIISSLPKLYANAIKLMAFKGYRVGALHTIKKVCGNRYTLESKGKIFSTEFETDFSKEDLEALGNISTAGIQRMINYYLAKLHQEGKINNLYSPHDFRHFFAVNFYEKTKDIYRLKEALKHSSISITERYLKGLGQI